MRTLNLKAIWPESSGCEYYIKEVKAFTGGKITFIGTDNGVSVVTVQCNSNECLRYSNLKEISVQVNQTVKEDDLIGSVYSFAKLEYCTAWKQNSTRVIRVYNKTYYLQDPMPFIRGEYKILVHQDVKVVAGPSSLVKLTPAQIAEFGNSRGDNIVEF